jgi:integrase
LRGFFLRKKPGVESWTVHICRPFIPTASCGASWLFPVKQWPNLGVRTKFKKHATTYLLDIPDLLAVVRTWDLVVRGVLPPGGAWYAHLLPSGQINPKVKEPGLHRRCRLNKDLHDWLERVGLPYHKPHKFRHGFATYALKRCTDVADLKAVSQNLMHSSLQVTDSIYSILSSDDVAKRIAGPRGGEGCQEREATQEVIAGLEAFLDQLKKEPAV